ncbi:C-type lectin domain family 4 member K-like [Antechinus flavipes]|uniref:C-type lectin domain family 4 member K-like n=1 Tax=Antechinus flavipes TaxID=38775 RepID=UPI00223662AB|nr:C-type lectin domain family 4 member K-like [Antechinus flavipes]
MELDGIYENVTQRNAVPQAGKGLSHRSYNLGQSSNVLANRRPWIIYTTLALLLLILVASLAAVTYLYLQMKTINTTSETHRWKADAEKANASLVALRNQNKILKQKLSEIYTVHKGHLYYFSCDVKPWDAAEETCVSKGSHLTSVTSVDEQEFLYNKANGVHFWNGLNRKEDQKTFRWSDGTSFDESKTQGFWRDGEPNNNNGNEHCVHFLGKELKSWNDLNCGSSLRFICKWNCESSGACQGLL